MEAEEQVRFAETEDFGSDALAAPPGATASGFGSDGSASPAALGPLAEEAARAFERDLLDGTVAGCLLEEMLGRGSMGTVFRAVHLALDKPVAVKVLNPALFHLKRHVDQFFREARAAAALEHPNIVTVYNVGQERGRYYIVMQYVRGESLADRLAREGRLTVPEAVRVGLEAARGLAAAHEKGVVHRDVKPANLLLTLEGAVKVADFGLAYRSSETAEATGRAEVMGTPYYIPPEQIAGTVVDHRADQYSLGVTLYYCLTGVRPFEAPTAGEVLVKHLAETPAPPERHRPEVPEALSLLVRRLLAKKPGGRFARTADLIRALEETGLAG